MTILNRSGFFVLNPDFAFKKRKNFFPFKTFISQLLWNTYFNPDFAFKKRKNLIR